MQKESSLTGAGTSPRDLPETGTLSREEFERWLALQQAMGWTVRNPEVITKIRKEFRKGATLAPFRQIHDSTP